MIVYKKHSKVYKILCSKLFNNLWNQFLLYGFSHVLPFLLMPFLLNTIGVEKYGLVNFAIAFAFYFQVVNEWGFDLSNVRHVVMNRDNKDALSQIFSSIQICKFCLLFVSLIIYASLVLLIPSLETYKILYAFAFIRLLGIIMTPYWLFRSLEDVKYVTRISLIVKIVCILPIFMIVRTPTDYIWVIIFFAMETLFSGIVSLYVVKSRYNIRFKWVSKDIALFYFKDSIPFFTSTFCSRIYQQSNTVILGFFCGNSITGVYSASEKLYNAYASFVSPILSQVFYPYFQRIKDFTRINRILTLLTSINALFLFCVYFISPYTIPLFINENVESILLYFNLFLILLAVSIPNDVLGFPYLGVMGYVNKVNYSTIVASIFYMCAVCVLVLCGKITICNLIFILISVNFLCVCLRIFFIKRYRKCLKQL